MEEAVKPMTRTWFLDTNVLANWVMARGGVMEVLHDHANLPQSFVDAYLTRHENALSFMERVMSGQHRSTDTFYASHLTVNELWKAIKEEATAVLQFQKGTPVSQWRDVRNRPKFSESLVEAIYAVTMDAIVGRLLSKDTVQVVQEASQTEEGYFDIFVPILFLPRYVATMDATLITTAVYYDADHFVTRDKQLLRAVNLTLGDRLELRCVEPHEAIRLLDNG